MAGPTGRRLLALVLATATLSAVRGHADPGPAEPCVVLLTVDTLRADRVGLYGGGRLPTPSMDRLGREGAVVRHAFAPVGRTTQAVTTILTGQHPFRHGVDGLDMSLPASLTTLAERFRARGYGTEAFVSNVNLSSGHNFEQGFDVYDDPPARWKGNSAAALSAWVADWLRKRETDRPHFLWVHYLDPHWPYEPDDEYMRRADPDWSGTIDVVARQRRNELTKGQILYHAPRLLDARALEHLRRAYDAEVAATDAAIATLLHALRDAGVLDQAILAFTADHGEALGEHGYWFGHGDYLYDETLRVPMAFRAPGRIPPGTELEGTLSLMDVAPTLLALAGVPFDAAEFDGRDLSPMLRAGGAQRVPPVPIVHFNDHLNIPAESPRRVPGREGRWVAIRHGGWKLIRKPVAPARFETELYAVDTDPQERRNLAADRPDEVARLGAELDRAVARFDVPTSRADAVIDVEKRRALESLGYIDADPPPPRPAVEPRPPT